MELSIISPAATSAPRPVEMPAPQPVADKRPTADAAALQRDPAPPVPLPIPASSAQAAAIARNMIAPTEEPARAGAPLMPEVAAAERTLKPYGVTMLPSREPPAHAPDDATDRDAAPADDPRSEATES